MTTERSFMGAWKRLGIVLLFVLFTALYDLSGRMALAQSTTEETPDTWYVSAYYSGSIPRDTNLSANGTNLPASLDYRFPSNFAFGFKVGVFPALTLGALGIEGELTVNDSSITTDLGACPTLI